MIEIAKQFGGSETDVEPAFAEIRKILPEVAAVATPAALPGLFQQGQVDLMYINTQTVTALKARGVDIEFVVPETGASAFVTTMHIAKGAKAIPPAYDYIDTVLATPVQDALAKNPYYLTPVNKEVDPGADVPMKSVADRQVQHLRLEQDQPAPRPLDRSVQQGDGEVAMNRPGGAALLALPLGVAQLLLFAAPLLLLTATSFSQDENLRGFSLRAWGELLGDGFNLRALLNTMKLGALTVLSATVLAVPLGLVHQVAGAKLRRAILIAAVLPLLTSVVVRSFAWIAILGREGVISQTLQATGLAASPVQLLQTEPGLILALTQIEMPLMLLPLLSALGRLEPALLDASAVLGASLARTLARVVLPTALPGLLAGATLVFASSSTAFISQSVIGGGRLVYLPAMVWQQAMLTFDWPLAAAIALLLMVAVLLVAAGFSAVGRRVHA